MQHLDANLADVMNEVVAEIGGATEMGRQIGQLWKDFMSGDLRHSQRALDWTKVLLEKIKDKNRMELDGGLEQMPTEKLQELVRPLALEWVRSDPNFRDELMKMMDPESALKLLELADE